MTTKKHFGTALLMLLFCATSMVSMAQDNSRVPFYNGNIEYKKPSGFLKAVGALGALGKDPSISTEDTSIVPTLLNSIRMASADVYRVIVQEGDAPQGRTSEESYCLEGTLSNVMTETGKYKGARCDIELRLVDLQTGKTVAQHKYNCGETYTNLTQENCITFLAEDVRIHTSRFLWNYFPLTGKILQKGVEQNNGKVKENQCYIDLGESVGVYKDMQFSVYGQSSDKEIGTLKVKEVQGEDISACAITKGDKKITQAVANGETLVIKTKFKF